MTTPSSKGETKPTTTVDIRAKVMNIIKKYAGEGNDDFINKIVALIGETYEKGYQDARDRYREREAEIIKLTKQEVLRDMIDKLYLICAASSDSKTIGEILKLIHKLKTLSK